MADIASKGACRLDSFQTNLATAKLITNIMIVAASIPGLPKMNKKMKSKIAIKKVIVKIE